VLALDGSFGYHTNAFFSYLPFSPVAIRVSNGTTVTSTLSATLAAAALHVVLTCTRSVWLTM
jgi:hypothetical protein